jgi:hypothetical protein
MVPGVSVGKSWARALAQTAAWSTVAGVVTSLMLGMTQGTKHVVIGGTLSECCQVAAHLIIYGLCMACVPMLTAKIFSGAAPAAAAIVGAGKTAWAGLRLAAGATTSVAAGTMDGLGRAGARAQAMNDGKGLEGAMAVGRGEQGLRPHKVGMLRRAVGAVVDGVVSPAAVGLGYAARRLDAGAGARKGGEAPGPRRGGRNAAGRKSAGPSAGEGANSSARPATDGAAPPPTQGRVERLLADEPGISKVEAMARADGEWAREQLGSARSEGERGVVSRAVHEQVWARGAELGGADQEAYLQRVEPYLRDGNQAAAGRLGGGAGNGGAGPVGGGGPVGGAGSAAGPAVEGVRPTAAAAAGADGAGSHRGAPASAGGPGQAAAAASREPRPAPDYPTGRQAVGHQDVTGQYGAEAPLALVAQKPDPLPHQRLVRRAPRPPEPPVERRREKQPGTAAADNEEGDD